MRRSLFSGLFIFPVLFISCGGRSGDRTDRGKRYDEFQTGTVIEKVVCRNDPSASYALYLPSRYSQGNVLPVLIAFDPHASGNLPVEKYRSIAEKYGYILLGSNDSKNGLPLNQTQSIIGSLLDDVRNRYASDSNRIYLLGFSGGARVAAMVALYGGGIRGVIGCGAGFPGGDQPGRFRFDYIGLAGNEDFNMNELIILDTQLEEANFRHALLVFNGKHDWPPVEIMEEAFVWNQFCAMKEGLIKKDNLLVSSFKEIKKKELQKDQEKGELYRKQDDLKQMIRFLEGLENTDELKKQLADIYASLEFKKAETSINAIREKEMNEQRMYAENFYLKDIDWWKKQKTSSEQRIANSKDQQEVLMYKRIMSYLSLMAYMQYSGALSEGNKDKADFALEVYRIVDPDNAAKIK